MESKDSAMREFDEQNWRVFFWNLWEEWDEGQVRWLLRLFPHPVPFMKWAESPCADLDGLPPWRVVLDHGMDRLVEYLGYLTNKHYWDRVCREYHDRQSAELSA